MKASIVAFNILRSVCGSCWVRKVCAPQGQEPGHGRYGYYTLFQYYNDGESRTADPGVTQRMSRRANSQSECTYPCQIMLPEPCTYKYSVTG